MSLAFEWVIHQWLVNSPHKGPVTRKMFPFDDVIILRPQKMHIIWVKNFNNSKYTGGRLNKKDSLTRYGDSHVKDKTS